MEIHVNGESKHVADDITVAALLTHLGLADRRVAVEVNRDLVPRGGHDATRLQSGDRIEIVTLVGGG